LIRAATESDIPRIIVLGRLIHAESPSYRDTAYCPERVGRLAQAVIDEDLMVVAEVEEIPIGRSGGEHLYPEDGGVVGIAAAHHCERYWSGESYAADLVVYVHPGFRKARLATELVKGLEDAVRSKGIPRLMLGVTTGVADELVGRLYQGMDYDRVGSIYSKDLTPPVES
jgi:GNAT superfamily N-acetyltransferase